MVLTFNPAAPVPYFRLTMAYYGTGVQEAEWYAPHGHFGLQDGAPVDFKILEQLYAGVAPDGTPLLSNTGGCTFNRQSAYDLTFSVPKSFSLIYAMASDEERPELIKILFAAVRSALGAAEKVAGWARRGKGGKILEAISFTAALFLHDDARPSTHADGSEFGNPDQHVHCVILNLAMRADGTIGAIQSVLLRNAKMLAGAVFHAALAASVLRLRFGVDRIGNNGIFEIAGIPEQVIKFFSGRRQEIERRLEGKGITSAQNPALQRKQPSPARRRRRPPSRIGLPPGGQLACATTSTSTSCSRQPAPPSSRSALRTVNGSIRNNWRSSHWHSPRMRRFSPIWRLSGLSMLRSSVLVCRLVVLFGRSAK